MDLIFHIGYPKAGSSLLQKYYFDKLDDVIFLGRYPLRNVGISQDSKINDSCIYLRDTTLRDWHDRLVSVKNWNGVHEIGEFLTFKKVYGVNDTPVLLSSEFVSSVFFSHPDIDEKLNRIKALGVDRVLLVIRNQVDLLKSMYRDHPFDPLDLVHGAPMSFSKWIRKSNLLEYSLIHSLDFAGFIRKIEKIFGSQKCLVLLAEQIFDGSENIPRQLSTFLKIDTEKSIRLLRSIPIENRGVSAKYNTIRKWKKYLLGDFPVSNYMPVDLVDRLKYHLKKGGKADIHSTTSDLEWLSEKFSKGNKEIEAKFDLPMSKYQYL